MKTPEIATDNNVGCKTPEEIKADAAACLTRPQKSECNRFALYKECAGDCRYVIKELYDLVLCYESRLAQAERDRDAAVQDIATFFPSPELCKHYRHCQSVYDDPFHGCLGSLDCSDYEYRGPCPENTKEE